MWIGFEPRWQNLMMLLVFIAFLDVEFEGVYLIFKISVKGFVTLQKKVNWIRAAEASNLNCAGPRGPRSPNRIQMLCFGAVFVFASFSFSFPCSFSFGFVFFTFSFCLRFVFVSWYVIDYEWSICWPTVIQYQVKILRQFFSLTFQFDSNCQALVGLAVRIEFKC